MPNTLQARLDDVDRAILRTLLDDARLPNNAVAQVVGIAPSTCLSRIRAMRDAGTIRGYHADIDLVAVGLPLQAMISVRLRGHSRELMEEFVDTMRQLPGVIATYFMGGADDYVLHVAAPTADALRDFVLDNLSSHPTVARTETSIIFQHIRGSDVLGPDDRPGRAAG